MTYDEQNQNITLKSQFVLIYVTAPSRDVALELSQVTLEQRLAACSNIIGGMTSSYYWEGKIESSEECLLILKSRRTLVPQIKTLLLKHHPYKVPCILELPITGGHDEYLRWVETETAKSSAESLL